MGDAAGSHVGRYAPSPTGDLHLGNLRTALLAWLFARSAGARFLIRIEDLDRGRVRERFVSTQLADLRALGLDWDGEPVRQSERGELYERALGELRERGRVYPCFCSRREVREAASAQHGPAPEGFYPGTCRALGEREAARRIDAGEPFALRLDAAGIRAGGQRGSAGESGGAERAPRREGAPPGAGGGRPPRVAYTDRLRGERAEIVDDLVLRRRDGAIAYNLAVVVDDAAQGVGEVVRGDDLLPATAGQALLCDLLGLPRPRWAHVPLVLGPDGARLAKRHGAVTLAGLAEAGWGPADARAWMAASLGLAEPAGPRTPAGHATTREPTTTAALLARFDPEALPRVPTTFTGPQGRKASN